MKTLIGNMDSNIRRERLRWVASTLAAFPGRILAIKPFERRQGAKKS